MSFERKELLLDGKIFSRSNAFFAAKPQKGITKG
jgi:hypothetical protein